MKIKGFFKNASGWFHANYHWAVAAVLVLMIFVHGGAGNNFDTLHLVPISEHLSITRAEFTLVFSSIKTVTSMLATFFSGFIISRYGCGFTDMRELYWGSSPQHPVSAEVCCVFSKPLSWRRGLSVLP